MYFKIFPVFSVNNQESYVCTADLNEFDKEKIKLTNKL